MDMFAAPKEKNFTFPAEMNPDTDLTRMLQQKKAVAEAQKKQEQEKAKQKQELEKAQLRQKANRQMLQMQMQNKKQQEQMKLKGQEYDRMDDLFQKNPQLLIKLVQLRQNTTSQQFSFAGISMDSVDLRLVARTLKTNTSLRSLHLTRKGLKDDDGVFLFKRLQQNHQLEKVELQGHQFESATAQAVGEYLANNKELKYLDLQFNFLTRGDVGQTGIQKLAEGLKKNQNLISLNLNNNSISYQGAVYLQEALEVNTTLIHFDFEMNSEMPLANVRQIKQYLIRNKAAYDAERFEQYLERRQLRKQEQDMDILMNYQAANNLEKQAIEERRYARQQAREELWKQEMLEYDLIKEQKIKQLQDAARMRKERGGKKKKGRRGKPKKK